MDPNRLESALPFRAGNGIPRQVAATRVARRGQPEDHRGWHLGPANRGLLAQVCSTGRRLSSPRPDDQSSSGEAAAFDAWTATRCDSAIDRGTPGERSAGSGIYRLDAFRV